MRWIALIYRSRIRGYTREIIEQVKAAVCKEALEMRKLNETVKVSGRRMYITMPDRQIGVAFYPAENPDAPLILGFHAGGFFFGGSVLNDAMWKETGKQLGAAIASVEYRKSPTYQYMDAIEDAYDAAVYFQEHSAEYGIDSNKISVMGCSAGANLAAAVCLYAKEKGQESLFCSQILMYPFLDLATDPDSKGNGSLQGPVMYVFNELHCKPEEATLPLVSPVFAHEKELEGLPKAIICYADIDCLKAEGQKYAQMLREAGVQVKDMVARGMSHGFYESGFGKISEKEMDFLGADVKEMIRNGKIAETSKECLEFVKRNYK